MFVLKVFDKSTGQAQLYKIDQTPCSIGRAVTNDIILEDSNVSAEHALIKQEDAAFILQDNNSTNGTLLNDRSIETSQLKNKDKIKVGTYIIEFLDPEIRPDETRSFKLPLEEKSKFEKKFETIFETIFELNKIKKFDYRLFLIYLGGTFLLSWYSFYRGGKTELEQFKYIIPSYLGTILAIFSSAFVLSLFVKVFRGFFGYFTMVHFLFKAFLFIFLYSSFRKYLYFSISFYKVVDTVLLSFLCFYFFYGVVGLLLPRLRKIYLASGIVGLAVLYFSGMSIWNHFDIDDKSYSLNTTYYFPILTYKKESYPISKLEDKLLKSFEKVGKYRKEELDRIKKISNFEERNYIY